MIIRPSVKLGKDRKKLTLGPNLGPLKYFEAASRACAVCVGAWMFMYLFDLNIRVLIIECRRCESSGRRTALG